MDKYYPSVKQYDEEKYDDLDPRSSPSRASGSLSVLERKPQINERRLIRKIDLSILPILFCSYFLQFLDKVIYNVSPFVPTSNSDFSPNVDIVCQCHGHSEGLGHERQ